MIKTEFKTCQAQPDEINSSTASTYDLPRIVSGTDNANILIENKKYDKLIEEHKNAKPLISLEKFCKEKGVDLEDFRQYRKKRMKQK